ncbi:AAA family ATPase [Nostoc minutum NIES-26]|uniref:AAA family ATPase n=1 Tax=Nostoc minutum NIES-26 TaxID=1844469 RepID=A0A367R1F2_9NOSO|nr:AAA family ATPase [Nostoc minutum NIES-26]
MNNLEHWQQQNEEYLAIAVTWLRLRLALMQPNSADEVDSETATKLDQLQITLDSAGIQTPPPALIELSQRFRLSQFEQEVLLLCAAIELDTRIAPLCALAQDNSLCPYPTFSLALALFDNPAWDVLSPERPLRYWRLLEINQPGNQPLTTSALRADERIVNYIKGLNYLDDRLTPLLMPLDINSNQYDLPPSQQIVVETAIRRLKNTTQTQALPVIQLLGNDQASKQIIAQEILNSIGLYLYCLPVELLPTQAAELETLARLWQRESILLPIALYLDASEITGNSPTVQALQRFLTRTHGCFFLDTREIMPIGRKTAILDVAKPTPSEQRTAWAAALGTSNTEITGLLASQFNLNIAAINQIARTALSEVSDNTWLTEQLWHTCLDSTRSRLDALAQPVVPKVTWDNLVLPSEAMNLLRQIAEQVRQRGKVYEDWGFHNHMNRGLGISALFAGESGTGKTMAAEVIAQDLHLNLYRIDLSAVVSKYIGETEKNLRRLFDAAEDGGTILFFDEADAVFGKRSEVKDSHDRYANIEINYLLQRLETYQGLAILATNMKNALDEAFVRRLRFIVDFPFPGLAERKTLWQKVFPSETPTEGLNFDRLARFNLTGGNIHNIALNAAFLAVSDGTHVTMPIVLQAVRTELRKLERPINEADFRF